MVAVAMQSFMEKPCFKHLSKQVRTELRKRIKRVTVAGDTTLFRKGDFADELYYLVKGVVRESVDDSIPVDGIYDDHGEIQTSPRNKFRLNVGKVQAALRVAKATGSKMPPGLAAPVNSTNVEGQQVSRKKLQSKLQSRPAAKPKEPQIPSGSQALSQALNCTALSPLTSPIEDRLKLLRIQDAQKQVESNDLKMFAQNVAAKQDNIRKSLLLAAEEKQKAAQRPFAESFGGFNARIGRVMDEAMIKSQLAREQQRTKKPSKAQERHSAQERQSDSSVARDSSGTSSHPLQTSSVSLQAARNRRCSAKRLSAEDKLNLGWKYVPPESRSGSKESAGAKSPPKLLRSPSKEDATDEDKDDEDDEEEVDPLESGPAETGTATMGTASIVSSKERHIREGEVIGQFCFFKNERHKSSARTLCESEILVLTRSDFDTLVREDEKRKQNERIKFLKRFLPASSELSTAAFEKLAAHLHDDHKPRGALLCVEGEVRGSGEKDRLRVIVEGQARVVKGGIWAAQKKQLNGALGVHESAMKPLSVQERFGVAIETLLPGQIINGSSQLLGEAEPFSVVADSAEVVVISISGLKSLNNSHPFLFENLRVVLETQRFFRHQRLAVLDATPALDLATGESLQKSPGLLDSPFLKFKRGLIKDSESSTSICHYFRRWVPPELKVKSSTSDTSKTWNSKDFHHLHLSIPLPWYHGNENDASSVADTVERGRSPTPQPQRALLDNAISVRGKSKNADLSYQGPPPSIEEAIKTEKERKNIPPEEQQADAAPSWQPVPTSSLSEAVVTEVLPLTAPPPMLIPKVEPSFPITAQVESGEESETKNKTRPSFSGTGRIWDAFKASRHVGHLVETNEAVEGPGADASSVARSVSPSSPSSPDPSLRPNRRRPKPKLSTIRDSESTSQSPTTQGVSLPPVGGGASPGSSMRPDGVDSEHGRKPPEVAEAIWWPEGTSLKQSTLGGSCMGPFWEGASVSPFQTRQGVDCCLASRVPVLEQRGGMIMYVDTEDPFIVTSPRVRTLAEPDAPKASTGRILKHPHSARAIFSQTNGARELAKTMSPRGPEKLPPMTDRTERMRKLPSMMEGSQCAVNPQSKPVSGVVEGMKSIEDLAGMFNAIDAASPALTQTLPPTSGVSLQTQVKVSQSETLHPQVLEQMCSLMQSLDGVKGMIGESVSGNLSPSSASLSPRRGRSSAPPAGFQDYRPPPTRLIHPFSNRSQPLPESEVADGVYVRSIHKYLRRRTPATKKLPPTDMASNVPGTRAESVSETVQDRDVTASVISQALTC